MGVKKSMYYIIDLYYIDILQMTGFNCKPRKRHYSLTLQKNHGKFSKMLRKTWQLICFIKLHKVYLR